MERLFPGDGFGFLIHSQASKNRMANMPIPRPVPEGNFGHEPGFHPMRFPANVARVDEWAVVGGNAVKFGLEIAQSPVAESRAHVARVAELFLFPPLIIRVIHAQQQRTYAGARTLG